MRKRRAGLANRSVHKSPAHLTGMSSIANSPRVTNKFNTPMHRRGRDSTMRLGDSMDESVPVSDTDREETERSQDPPNFDDY